MPSLICIHLHTLEPVEAYAAYPLPAKRYHQNDDEVTPNIVRKTRRTQDSEISTVCFLYHTYIIYLLFEAAIVMYAFEFT